MATAFRKTDRWRGDGPRAAIDNPYGSPREAIGWDVDAAAEPDGILVEVAEEVTDPSRIGDARSFRLFAAWGDLPPGDVRPSIRSAIQQALAAIGEYDPAANLPQ